MYVYTPSISKFLAATLPITVAVSQNFPTLFLSQNGFHANVPKPFLPARFGERTWPSFNCHPNDDEHASTLAHNISISLHCSDNDAPAAVAASSSTTTSFSHRPKMTPKATTLPSTCDNKKRFRCDVNGCSRTYSSLGNLKMHHKAHRGIAVGRKEKQQHFHHFVFPQENSSFAARTRDAAKAFSPSTACKCT